MVRKASLERVTKETDIKVNIIHNNSFEDIKLLSHINSTFKNLNLIKNEVLERTVSNESIEYLKELEEDFLDEIYQDVNTSSIISEFNADDTIIIQEKVNLFCENLVDN